MTMTSEYVFFQIGSLAMLCYIIKHDQTLFFIHYCNFTINIAPPPQHKNVALLLLMFCLFFLFVIISYVSIIIVLNFFFKFYEF